MGFIRTTVHRLIDYVQLAHRLTNRLLSTYVKLEDQILNMFYIV